MDDNQKSIIFAIISVFFWSTVATAFKIALNFVTPFQLLAYSSFFSSIILLITLLSQGKLKSLLSISKKDILASVAIGFLNPFLYYLVLFKAYSLLPAQEALALNYTWAIVLTILTSIFQKKKITFISYLALVISFFGVLVIISKGNILTLKPSNTIGAVLALSSSLVWGFSWVMNIASKVDDEIRLFLNFSFGALFSFLFLNLTNQFIIPKTFSFLSILYVSLFEMSITFILWNKALKKAPNPAKVNNLIYASPLISVFFINLILGESIFWFTILGLILIILGILVQNAPLQNRQKR